MQPIHFPEVTQEIPIAPDKTLPIFFDPLRGEVVTKWELSEEELAQIQQTKSFFISQYPNQTAVPTLEIGFKPLDEKEKAQLEKLAKQAHVKENQAKRNRRFGVKSR